MPDETVTIAPALTAEVWADLRRHNDGSVWGISDSPRIAHEQMAVANAALPDRDPRKITTFDVTHVRVAREFMPAHTFLAQQLAKLEAKLAALLPPE